MRFHYIAIDGPPGVGKTALAERLGGKEGSVVLEEEGNPFLPSYYAGKPGAAFQAQMFFLLSRYRQLSELSQRELFHQFTVCDFLLAKDKIFAYLNLEDTELALYEKIYGVLESEVPLPELVIYLQAPAEVLNKRLKGKSRKGEPGPKEDYLRELVKAFDYFLLAKDKIFAYLNLEDTELALYEKIYGVLASEVPSPELVIYLQAPAEVLNKRLKGKSRKGEPGPREDYLRELVKAFDYFFFHYSVTPLLIVNTTDVDFSDSDTDLDDLLREIDTIEGGTRFFKPARES